MPYQLSEKELNAVSLLEAKARLNHFVKRAADWEEVWSLRNAEGWVLAQTSSGQEAAPVWPHLSYAALCASGEWADCEPAVISLQAFMEKWLPGLAKDKRLVSVFPTTKSWWRGGRTRIAAERLD